MNIDKTVDELRSVAATWENGWESEYDISAICENAADQLERLQAENSMLENGNKQIIEDYKLCAAERDELKANKPVRCGECRYIFERHYEDEFEPPYIKYGCKYRGNYQVFLNDFCSCGERVVRVERD